MIYPLLVDFETHRDYLSYIVIYDGKNAEPLNLISMVLSSALRNRTIEVPGYDDIPILEKPDYTRKNPFTIRIPTGKHNGEHAITLFISKELAGIRDGVYTVTRTPQAYAVSDTYTVTGLIPVFEAREPMLHLSEAGLIDNVRHILKKAGAGKIDDTEYEKRLLTAKNALEEAIEHARKRRAMTDEELIELARKTATDRIKEKYNV